MCIGILEWIFIGILRGFLSLFKRHRKDIEDISSSSESPTKTQVHELVTKLEKDVKMRPPSPGGSSAGGWNYLDGKDNTPRSKQQKPPSGQSTPERKRERDAYAYVCAYI